MAVQSFPAVHVTGAVHHFVRCNGTHDLWDGDILYLGTAEVTPQMQRRRYKTNVMNDIAGKTLPFQKTYDGEAATLSTLLTYWSKPAVEAVRMLGVSRGLVGVNPLTGFVSAGSESRWSRGALVYGQLTFELWQVFENSLNPLTITPFLETGWYWPQVELLDDDTVSCGTGVEKLLMVMDATPYWIPNASASGVNVSQNERGFRLYSTDDANFPADVLVPQ